MIHGWKIFAYSKKINKNTDYRSACNTDLLPYRQALYIEQDSRFLTIYSNTSRQLEISITNGILEIKLSIWSIYKTQNILVERISFKSLEYSIDNKSIAFISESLFFSVIFYKKEDMEQFVEHSNKTELNEFIDSLSAMTEGNQYHSPINTNKIDFKTFINKMSDLSKNIK